MRRLVAVVLAMALAPAAGAQSDPLLRVDIDRAFNQLFDNPGDPELTRGYAQLQIRAGNFEAAVAALERLLLLNPNQPRLVLELGVLYLRMGSYQFARAYLARAARMADLSAEERARAEGYLAESETRASAHQFSGSLMAGLRYQTNATLAPHADRILVLGFPIPNPDRPRGDGSFTYQARLNHSYDFGTDDRTAWQSQVAAFGSRYFSAEEMNLFQVELQTGPRFMILGDTMRGSSLRPYALASFAMLDDRPYQDAVGAGLDATFVINERLVLDGGYQYRRADYRAPRRLSFANFLDGDEHALRARLGYQATPALLLLGEISSRFVDARRPFNDFLEGGFVASAILDYDSPVGGGRTWSVVASAGVFQRGYQAPDRFVTGRAKRRETETRLGLAHVIPLTDRLELVQQVDGIIITSNIANYERRDLSISVAVRWRF